MPASTRISVAHESFVKDPCTSWDLYTNLSSKIHARAGTCTQGGHRGTQGGHRGTHNKIDYSLTAGAYPFGVTRGHEGPPGVLL